MENYVMPEMIRLEENLVIGTMKAHHVQQIVFNTDDPLQYVGGIWAVALEADHLVFYTLDRKKIYINPDKNNHYFWCRDVYNKLIECLRKI